MYPTENVIARSGHEKPSDAFVVTDPSMQHSLFFRATDKSSRNSDALQKIADLAHSSSAEMEGGQTQPSSSSWEPSTNQTAEMAADERLAHRLQASFSPVKSRGLGLEYIYK